MNIGWPEGIYLALVMIDVGINLAKWGQPRTDERYASISTWMALVIVLGLLWWGGFFA